MGHRSFEEASSLNEPRLSLETIANRIGQLHGAFDNMTKNPPGGAEEYIAFAQYTKDCIETPRNNPAVVEFYKDILNFRRKSSAQYIAQLSRIAFQYYLRYSPVENAPENPFGRFPDHAQTPEEWHDNYSFIFSYDKSHQVVDEAISTKDVDANKPLRYAGAKLAILAHIDMLPNPFDLADLGCSVGLGQFLLGENLPIKNVRVMGSPADRELIHWAWRIPLNIHRNIGIDKLPDKDWQWVESCNTYAYQYRDEKFLQEQARMYRERRNFKIIQGDITLGDKEGGIGEAREHYPTGRSNVATAINSFWEIKEDREGDPETNFREVTPGSNLENAYIALEGIAKNLVILQEAARPGLASPYPAIAKDIYDKSASYSLYSRVLGTDAPYRRLADIGDFSFRSITPTDALIQKLQTMRREGYLEAS